VTKVRTKVVAHARDRTVRVNDKPTTEKEAGELVGRVIVSERTAKGWKHTLAEGKPTEKEAEALESFGTFRDGAAGLPEGRVRPGHTWEVTADYVAKFFALNANEYAGKLKARFVRVETVGGEECAVIETEGAVKAKVRMDKGVPGSAEMAVKLTEYRSLARGFAVKYALTGDARLSFKEASETAESHYELAGKMKVEGTATVVK
jgi:hypothetical protein